MNNFDFSAILRLIPFQWNVGLLSVFISFFSVDLLGQTEPEQSFSWHMYHDWDISQESK